MIDDVAKTISVKIMTDEPTIIPIDEDNLPPDIIITYREGDKIYRKELVIIERENSPPDIIVTIRD